MKKGMTPFDDTGVTLTTDELAALQTGYPAGPDAEKRAEPTGRARFFCFYVLAVCHHGRFAARHAYSLARQPH